MYVVKRHDMRKRIAPFNSLYMAASPAIRCSMATHYSTSAFVLLPLVFCSAVPSGVAQNQAIYTHSDYHYQRLGRAVTT